MFPFHVDFSLPMLPLLSKPLYISMRRRNMYFFITQSKKKSVNLGTLPVFFITKHLVKMLPIYLSGSMKEFTWKKYMEKWRNCMEHVKDFSRKMKNYMDKWWIWLKKWKALYDKNLEKWRICVETRRIKKSEEFPWKNDEFVWTS